jgi:general secretion pathway protein D
MRIMHVICCLALIAGCTAGRTAFDKAQKLEQEGKLDEAYIKYAEVSTANPDKYEYRLSLLRTGQEAARVHFQRAEDYMAAKNYDSAIQEYQAASILDPSLERAKQQMEVARNLRDSLVYYKEGTDLEKKNKFTEAYRSYKKSLELNPENTEAKTALKRMSQNRKTKIDGFELNLKSNKPITLKFRDARIKDVFSILGRLSGINFIFDESVRDQNFTIFLENATFQQALDIITNMNKLGRKVLNESTILIYANTPEKSKQYEELVVRTFFLNNLDAKKAINLLRTMLQIKKVYVNEELNAIVIRDVPETVEVAQKILEANDVPDAEVLLEVEVIELSRDNAETFGLTLNPYSVSIVGANNGVPILNSLPSPLTSTSGLQNVARWSGFEGFMTIPNATYNFGKTLAKAEVLANPKIRVKNREKSKFNVATRQPIVTIATTGTTGGFSTNVQYVDVGVKVNAEPTILQNNEVNLKLSLEVSQNLGTTTLSDGTSVITIGTRNLDTVLSVKDGETSIIGGLIQANVNKNQNKIFILGDIPIIGPLLTGYNNKNTKTELVLALTPRIVRLPAAPQEDLKSFWSGKEDEPSSTSPFSSFSPEQEPAPNQPAMPQGQAGQGLPFETVQPPPAPQATAPGPSQQQEGRGTVTMSAPSSVAVDDQFALQVNYTGSANLYSTPFVLAYNPNLVDVAGVTEGNFLKQDGKTTEFRSSIDSNSGKVSVISSRVGNVGGVSGTGTLVNMLFKSKAKGVATFGIQDAKFSTPEGGTVTTSPYNVAVEIR